MLMVSMDTIWNEIELELKNDPLYVTKDNSGFLGSQSCEDLHNG